MGFVNAGLRKITHIFSLTPVMVAFTCIALCVFYLGFVAKTIHKKTLDYNLSMTASYAASLINMSLHEQLILPDHTNSKLYKKAILPLVKLHNSLPDIKYLYTIKIDNDKLFFILDTANSDLLVSDEELEASAVMDEYDIAGNNPQWIKTIKTGSTYVDSEPIIDAFGSFISASAPLYNDQGKLVGLIGVDMDADNYLLYTSIIEEELAVTLLIGLLLSLAVGIWARRNDILIENLQIEQHQLTITDSLTGAFNRRYFEEQSQHEWSRSKRYNISFVLASLDLDLFKNINDTYGHQAGDACLKQFVTKVQDHLRKSDSLIRMGGEEFLILMVNTELSGAKIVTERIRRNIANDVVISDEGEEIKFTVSIGIAIISEDDKNIDYILKRADKALYEAKDAGRNRVIVNN